MKKIVNKTDENTVLINELNILRMDRQKLLE